MDVLDPSGGHVGKLTDAASLLEESAPRVVVALTDAVRARLGLGTHVVDIETRFLRKDSDGTIRLREPLLHVLRQSGFSV